MTSAKGTIPISEKIKATKQEIANLQNEFEKLMNLETNKPPVIHQDIVTISKPITPNKPYDVEEARNYIRKQKDKRIEATKSRVKDSQTKIQETKSKEERLKELQQKTREIVVKNVQLKRQRSKSRDNKEIPVRPDKSKSPNCPTIINKQKGNVLEVPSATRQSRNRSASTDRTPMDKCRLKTQNGSSNVCSRSSRSQTRSQATKTEPRNERINNKLTIGERSPNMGNESPNIDLERTRMPPKRELVEDIRKLSQIDQGLANLKPATKESTDDLNKNITFRDRNPSELQETNFPPFKNITLRRKDEGIEKETQTSITNKLEDDLNWPEAPYPYNFINTVKRKLQIAVNSPKHTQDVGVQSSIMAESERIQSAQEFREIISKNSSKSLKSFISHKNLNLDLKAVENLELISGKNKSEPLKPSLVSRQLFSPSRSSESDTSKNIPEISSESISLAKQKSTRFNDPKLKLDQIEGLKLTLPSSTVLKPATIVNGSLISENLSQKTTIHSYTSDFTGNSKKSTEITNERTSRTPAITGGGSLGSKSEDSSQKTTIQSYSSNFTVNSKKSNETTNGKSKMSEERDPLSQKSLSEDQGSNTIIEIIDSDDEDSCSKKATQNTFQSLRSNITTSKYNSKSLSGLRSDEISEKSLVLKEPPISLNLRRGDHSNHSMNETHLKFEAEVHLLNDFHESMKQLIAVEDAYEHFKRKNNFNLQNADTETSFIARTSTTTTSMTSAAFEVSKKLPNSINFSRGSDIIEELDNIMTESNNNKSSKNNSTLSNTLEWNLSNSNLNFSELSNTTNTHKDESDFKISLSNIENYDSNLCAGLSLNMFDHLIQEEDARIKQLKVNLQIRHKVLLSRTRAELALLEIHRKQLTETGRLEEASVIKKRQRGILVKHEQESNEIKRLEEAKKAESKERKGLLKRQRNLIKTQLSHKGTLGNIKITTPRKRRSYGPLVVLQSCTSSSKNSNASVSALSDSTMSVFNDSVVPRQPNAEISNLKRTLSMREEALKDRRKTVEELLRWHRRLLHEEKQIVELEEKASAIVKSQRLSEKAESAEPLHSMIQSNVTPTDIPENLSGRGDSAGKRSLSEIDEIKSDYSSTFEIETEDIEEKSNISSIAGLIHDFTRIEDKLTGLNKKSDETVVEMAPDEVLTDSGAPSESTVVEESPEDGDDRSKSKSPEVISTESPKESLQIIEEIQESAKDFKNEITEDKQFVSQELPSEVPKIEETVLDETKSSDVQQLLVADEVQSEVSDDMPTGESSATLDHLNSNEILVEENSREDSSSKSDEKTPKLDRIDVKKRVSEILADANVNSGLSRGDKSPRPQDLYTTTYDIASPVTSPDSLGSPEDLNTQVSDDIFGTEAQELLKKQLAIEQEIKQLEQQQKEQLPYVFMREIPNKPPPPYTPPSAISSPSKNILPTDPKEIDEITDYTSKVIFKAYQSNNLDNVKFSVKSFKLMSTLDMSKNCCEYLFNLSKDLALEHYNAFKVIENEPCWLKLDKKPQLAALKPVDGPGLEKLLNRKLKELLGFRKAEIKESAIIKWGRKKRDHVDEVLVRELQDEESQWTNYDKNELHVKDAIVNDIMKSLIADTATVLKRIIDKKQSQC